MDEYNDDSLSVFYSLSLSNTNAVNLSKIIKATAILTYFLAESSTNIFYPIFYPSTLFYRLNPSICYIWLGFEEQPTLEKKKFASLLVECKFYFVDSFCIVFILFRFPYMQFAISSPFYYNLYKKNLIYALKK